MSLSSTIEPYARRSSQELRLAVAPRLLIGCIGDNFQPGVWKSIKAAEEHTRQAGGAVATLVLGNLCIVSHMGLEAMRNMLIMKACDGGFDYLALVEDDCLLTDPSIFVSLVKRKVDIVAPHFDQSRLLPADSGKVFSLADPLYKAGQGLREVQWTVRSCVLFDCDVFAKLGERPFIDTPIYAAEEYHGLWFKRRGVTWWQDTDISATLLRPPIPPWEIEFGKVRFPFDSGGTDIDELMTLHREFRKEGRS